MKLLSRQEVRNALAKAGVRAGDVVHVQSDLMRLGPVEGVMSREGVCGFYLDALMEAVGAQGTISVLTAFEDYGRYATPYVREESPSRSGIFSEYVRQQKGSVRSMHPITSITALGARAEFIAGGTHFDGYGFESPWRRLHDANALLVSLGMVLDAGGLSFVHHIERLHGVPHQYTKLYDTPVYADGRRVPGHFTMSVRYLDFGIADTSVPFKRQLAASGDATVVKLGRSGIWAARASTVFDAGMAALRASPYAFLEKVPEFRKGEIPFDGVTGPMVKMAGA